jgi:uroporphyrinogen-III decarboxylase
MPETLTPRQVVKGLLQGVVPPRPLFLPIVFSHAARVENLSLRAFLTNPTKISNSLRQVRAHLRSDGITCYFDPFLEAEALGGVVHWEAEAGPPALRWPQQAAKGELPEGLRLPEVAANSGRVGVAVEVIRRLKAVVREDCLLTVGISGPFTLAALLTQLEHQHALHPQDIPPAAMDLAAAAISPIAAAFVEAGANVVFIREEVLPVLAAGDAEEWASRLAATINIIRFYEALPVLLLTCPRSVAANSEVVSRQPWDCVVCPVLDGIGSDRSGGFAELGSARLGIALPPQAFEPGEAGGSGFVESIRRAVSELRPAIVTTAGDLPVTADMERLKKVCETLR